MLSKNQARNIRRESLAILMRTHRRNGAELIARFRQVEESISGQFIRSVGNGDRECIATGQKNQPKRLLRLLTIFGICKYSNHIPIKANLHPCLLAHQLNELL